MPDKVAKAQALAERLRDVTPWELGLIKRRIREWAETGDGYAKGYVTRFAYCNRRHNVPIVDAIARLIEWG